MNDLIIYFCNRIEELPLSCLLCRDCSFAFICNKLSFPFKGTLLNQFDERDIERINNDSLYVWLFIKHKQKDIDKAIDMIVSILVFYL